MTDHRRLIRQRAQKDDLCTCRTVTFSEPSNGTCRSSSHRKGLPRPRSPNARSAWERRLAEARFVPRVLASTSFRARWPFSFLPAYKHERVLDFRAVWIGFQTHVASKLFRGALQITANPVPGKNRERVDSGDPASEATSTEKQGNLNAADVIRCSSLFHQFV